MSELLFQSGLNKGKFVSKMWSLVTVIWRAHRTAAVLAALLFCLHLCTVENASATTLINFEQFNDGDLLSTQIGGVTFANTIILSAGLSLNELDFPPHSGVNVAADSNGPISISFAAPISSFSGYFTYTSPLTVSGYDGSNNLLASTTSAYSMNYVSSGTPGSSPNEFLQISSTTGFERITLAGDPSGGSFVVDDIAFDSASSAVPEPSSLAILAIGLGALVGVGAMKR